MKIKCNNLDTCYLRNNCCMYIELDGYHSVTGGGGGGAGVF